MTLNPHQFVFHGTAHDVQGDRIVPAKVHGQGSYWGSTGSGRGEPAEEHAWAHPDEKQTWEFAMDRVNHTYQQWDESNPHPIAPRGRVYALHPHPEQSFGGDPSIPREIKAPHFEIAHRIDTMPGHQGTFPEVNWNEHVKHDEYLPGDEDANHPSDLSVQFGHHYGVRGRASEVHANVVRDAHAENIDRALARQDAVLGKQQGPPPKDEMLPGMRADGRAYQQRRAR